MDPDLYLYAEKARARELHAAAARHRAAAQAARESGSSPWRARLGWALVEAGLRLVHTNTRHHATDH
ncbi:hypothetical protein MF672_045555 [Actinomadura sp. ATCC 31491]|uniref:Uncharacterized protein n=1 Tax=Actinomadura luzonensis TaxID=2805427 RepID=A0ABT0GAA6_9ACTN|nr:hypothetical protein [Actinomadura luzonensis]MCK2221023.1 hypothetical protein [Actinomadura luzonensis]